MEREERERERGRGGKKGGSKPDVVRRLYEISKKHI